MGGNLSRLSAEIDAVLAVAETLGEVDRSHRTLAHGGRLRRGRPPKRLSSHAVPRADVDHPEADQQKPKTKASQQETRPRRL